jgi:4'-phosphopantetheinyl transferase
MRSGPFRPYRLPLNHLDLPAAGTVHLWYLDLAQLGSPLAQGGGEALTSLSPRQERTIRRFYLRLLLGAYLSLPGKEVVVSRMVRGKPVLNSDNHRQTVDFSIAGSAGCCLIGVCSEGLIGVDLELAGRRTGNPQGLARRYFNDSEARALAAVASDELDRAFLHTWACKEAVVKAAGHGIANQLCRFSVSTDPDSEPCMLEMHDDDPAAWRLAVVRPSRRHLGAVALRHGEMAIETFSLVHRD